MQTTLSVSTISASARKDIGPRTNQIPIPTRLSSQTGVSENTECNDGNENDADGLIDFDGGAGASQGGALCSGAGAPFDCCTGPGTGCAGSPDPQCLAAWFTDEATGCGLGPELMLLLSGLLWLRGRRRRSD